jgi:hypothetical protein
MGRIVEMCTRWPEHCQRDLFEQNGAWTFVQENELGLELLSGFYLRGRENLP